MDGGGRSFVFVRALKYSVAGVFVAATLGGCAGLNGDQSGLFSLYGPVGVDQAGKPAKTASRKVKTVHKVRKGETLYSVSRKYRIERAAVASYNKIDAPYLIMPGQLIRIPDVAYSIAQGRKHYRNGDYGLSEKDFRWAVEMQRKDPEAWVGLAASYDRLRRFDMASRAYDRAIKLAGRTPSLLNNLGYSYMLRGDFAAARKELMAAYKMDPHNPVIQNNLKLLYANWKNVRPDRRT